LAVSLRFGLVPVPGREVQRRPSIIVFRLDAMPNVFVGYPYDEGGGQINAYCVPIALLTIR
jgi:hypothetical protein